MMCKKLFLLALLLGLVSMAQADLVITNGTFDGGISGGTDVPDWYDLDTTPAGNVDWWNTTSICDGPNPFPDDSAFMGDHLWGGTAGGNRWMYQQIGTIEEGVNYQISFEYAQPTDGSTDRSVAIQVDIYQGVFDEAAQDVDIADLGLTLITSLTSPYESEMIIFSFTSALDLSLANTTDPLWLRISNLDENGNGAFVCIDNVQITSVPAKPVAIVSRYSFNDGDTAAIDSVGGKDGTLEGTATISGNKLVLDGAGAAWLPSDVLAADLESVTIEVWYTENHTGDIWSRLFDFGGTDASGGGGYAMFCVPHQYGTTRFTVATNGFATWQTGEETVSGPIFTGEQTHVVCVWDGPGAEIKIYLNGVLTESAATTMDLSAILRENAYIGDSCYTGDAYMTGTVDEFRIYSAALTDAEVLDSFNAGPDAEISAEPAEPVAIVYENDFEDPCQVDALSGWNWGDGGIVHNVVYADYDGNMVVEHTGVIDASAADITTRFGSKWGLTLSGNTSADPNDYTIEFDLRSVSGDWDPIDLEFFVLTGGGNGVGYGSGASSYAQADGWVHVAVNLADLTAGWWAGTAWDMTVPDWQIEVGGPPWPGITVPAGTPAWDQVWLMDNLKITMILKPEGPSTEGLVAYYAMEGDATDSSGNGFNGTIVGDPIYTDGAIGMAMDFNGDDYVDCGNDEAFSVTEYLTVALWVNIRTIPTAWTGAITKGNTAWRISNNNVSTGMHFGFEDGSRGWQAANSATQLNIGEWYHVCGVYDINVGAKIYINGLEDGSNPDTGGITQNTSIVAIGTNSDSTYPEQAWDGLLDEVMIFNRALSADEVAALAGM
jgi:hypothetical protein